MPALRAKRLGAGVKRLGFDLARATARLLGLFGPPGLLKQIRQIIANRRDTGFPVAEGFRPHLARASVK